MKKIIALLLAIVMILSLAACGKAETDKANSGTEPAVSETDAPVVAEKETAEETQPEEEAEEPEASEAPAEPEKTEEEQIEDDAWDQLESLGNIKTENGVLLVSITMPADLVGEDVTQEQLDAEAGEEYVSATLNDDGSVTYKLTKKQHKAMLDELTASMEETLQEMLDDEDYAFTDIKHNADYTVFDITLSTEEVGMLEGFMSIAFFMYAGFYGVFSGQEAENVVINYYNPAGDLIESTNSADLE